MTIPTTEQLIAIHNLYVVHSGMDVKYTTYHGFAFERFLHEGFTEQDLIMVCKFLRNEIRSGKSKLTQSCLKFRNLIEDLPAFADHRAMSIAMARKPVVDSGKAQALRDTGRVETRPERPVMTPARVLEQHQIMAKLLKEYRESQA